MDETRCDKFQLMKVSNRGTHKAPRIRSTWTWTEAVFQKGSPEDEARALQMFYLASCISYTALAYFIHTILFLSESVALFYIYIYIYFRCVGVLPVCIYGHHTCA